MNASKLLDSIMRQFQKLGPDAAISETIQAHKDCIKMIDDALLGEYERGCIDTSEKMHQMQIEKQKKNN